MVNNSSNLLPSTHERAKGVTEGYVLSMGVTLLYGFRVAFHKFTLRQSELLDEVVNVVLRSHLDHLSFLCWRRRYGRPLPLELPTKTLTTLRSTGSARIGPD